MPLSRDSFLEPPRQQHHYQQQDSFLQNSVPGEASSSIPVDCTRIVCMSDTHGKHRDIPFLPPGDILVHAGDFTQCGETDAVTDLSRYFAQQKESSGFQNVICIAGNHDISFHEEYYQKTWSRHIRNWDPSMTREALQNCTYLEDSSSTVSLRGIQSWEGGNQEHLSFHGSPWTPNFFNWAFNLKRGEALQEMWSKIPTHNTDVLVTHGPPHGRGDLTLHSGHFGCQNLLDEIQHRVKPRLHIFGHIHECYGASFDGQTLYVNASNLDIGYEAINPCIVVDLPRDKTQPAMIVEPQRWIRSVDDFVAWLHEHNYTAVANALTEVTSKDAVTHGRGMGIGKDRAPFVLPENLYSGASYSAICEHLGWKRRKHRPLKQQLQAALCQLYSESFL